LSRTPISDAPESAEDWERRAINFVELALSEHNFLSPDAYDKQCTNKGIILITDSKSAQYALPAVAEIIKKIKREFPELLIMPARYEIQARIRVLRDLMIPLGNIGFVELQDGGSYHTRDLCHLESQIPRELIGENETIGAGGVSDYYDRDLPGKITQLKQLSEFLRNQPDKTFRNRKLIMPSLIR
jgi:hypothetical protein